jgi:hypothetical protein
MDNDFVQKFEPVVYDSVNKESKRKRQWCHFVTEKSEPGFHSKYPYNFSILVGLYPKCFLKT